MRGRTEPLAPLALKPQTRITSLASITSLEHVLCPNQGSGWRTSIIAMRWRPEPSVWPDQQCQAMPSTQNPAAARHCRNVRAYSCARASSRVFVAGGVVMALLMQQQERPCKTSSNSAEGMALIQVAAPLTATSYSQILTHRHTEQIKSNATRPL